MNPIFDEMYENYKRVELKSELQTTTYSCSNCGSTNIAFDWELNGEVCCDCDFEIDSDEDEEEE